ncbi:hypothetical protein AMECASPLE_001639 [Ameca splendens]|uniref:Uncharacterized protein n=1 Tax=Ameca splendens TaxID=208324 RepID=A0ABV1A603_9TELE
MCAEFHKPRSKQEHSLTVRNQGTVDTFSHSHKDFTWMFLILAALMVVISNVMQTQSYSVKSVPIIRLELHLPKLCANKSVTLAKPHSQANSDSFVKQHQLMCHLIQFYADTVKRVRVASMSKTWLYLISGRSLGYVAIFFMMFLF